MERIRSQAVVAARRKGRDDRGRRRARDGIRVVHDGVIGFAATAELHPTPRPSSQNRQQRWLDAVSAAATERVELARRARVGEVEWVSEYEIDPTTVSSSDKVALLEALEQPASRCPGRGPRDAYVLAWPRTSTTRTCRAPSPTNAG